MEGGAILACAIGRVRDIATMLQEKSVQILLLKDPAIQNRQILVSAHSRFPSPHWFLSWFYRIARNCQIPRIAAQGVLPDERPRATAEECAEATEAGGLIEGGGNGQGGALECGRFDCANWLHKAEQLPTQQFEMKSTNPDRRERTIEADVFH